MNSNNSKNGVPPTEPSDPIVTGWVGNSDYFRFAQSDAIAPSLIVDVLRGDRLGVVFRNVVDSDTCEALINNFLTSPGRQRRGADAPGEYLGAYHYNKTIEEYLDQAEAVRHELETALDVPSEPLRVLFQRLAAELDNSGVELRRARHEGRDASPAIFRSWLGQQNFALEPHEDRGQCEDLKQADFEIQKVTRHQILGLNICLDNGPDGRLSVWNVRPDEDSRVRLGVQYTGSPYATEWLEGIEQVHLDIRPGDIYLFNAGHVHAVEPVRDPKSRRVTLSGILGFSDDRTVITWT